MEGGFLSPVPSTAPVSPSPSAETVPRDSIPPSPLILDAEDDVLVEVQVTWRRGRGVTPGDPPSFPTGLPTRFAGILWFR